MNVFNSPTRNHWCVLAKSFTDFFYTIIFFIPMLNNHPNYYLFSIPIFLIVIIFNVISWRKNIFYMNDNMIIINSGVIFNQKQEIPFNKISTLDIQQNIIHRLFNCYTIQVDTGASTLDKSEFKFIIPLSLVDDFKNTIQYHTNSSSTNNLIENEENPLSDDISYITLSKKDLILYSLTKNKLTLLITAFALIFNAGDFIANKMGDFLKDNVDIVIDNANNFISYITSNNFFYLLIITSIIVAYILVLSISVIMELIKFNDFKVYKSNNNINIEYGLLTKKKYSLPIDKINAVKLKQNFSRQLFNLYSIEVVVIGYGDINSELALIYPLANESIKNKLINDILPEFNFKANVIKPKNNVLLKFIIKRTFIPLLLLIIFTLLSSMPIKIFIPIAAILVISQIILGYRVYKNTSIGISSKGLSITNGSRTKITYLIKHTSVQSINKTQNILQKHKKIYNYSINICTNTFGEFITVKHLNLNIMNLLEETLIE